MHKYKTTFEIKPSCWFGLPEENTLVIPTNTKFEIYHSPFSKFYRPISLSQFRKVTERILKNFVLDNMAVKLDDNFIEFTFTAQNSEIASTKVKETLTKFLKILQVNVGSSFFYYINREILEDNRVIEFIYKDETGSSLVEGFSLVGYDLEKTNIDLDVSLKEFMIQDSKILRFCDYYDRATFLESFFLKEDYIIEYRYSKFLRTEIFLNYFKAITVIVGDQSVDSDYQSRYKKFGLDYTFFRDELEPLRVIRNNADIAHYSMSDSKRIEAEIAKKSVDVKLTAVKVYKSYVDFLMSNI
ncbi:MAG: hypothetical protein KBG21_09270 [Ignavibacteria bacterium]|nr:hypothetical protein [Ignavibacteria bacterium]